MTIEHIEKAFKVGGLVAGLAVGGWKLNDSLRETIRSEVKDLRERVAELPTRADVQQAQHAAVKDAREEIFRIRCPQFAVRGQPMICERIP